MYCLAVQLLVVVVAAAAAAVVDTRSVIGLIYWIFRLSGRSALRLFGDGVRDEELDLRRSGGKAEATTAAGEAKRARKNPATNQFDAGLDLLNRFLN